MKSIPIRNPNDTKRRSMIAVRNGFSDEKGICEINHQIQTIEFDDRSRMIISNCLFNFLEACFGTNNGLSRYDSEKLSHLFSKALLSEVFLTRTAIGEGQVFNWRIVFDNVHNVIENAPYNEVLDIIWFIGNWIHRQISKMSVLYYRLMNDTFETECIGYRFVDGRIVEITDSEEIQAIEEATNSRFDGCRTHLSNAVGFLADREKKDYKNCIKESISAVESICMVITQNEHATLGDALKILEKKRGLQGPLKTAFEKLYAYTNDKGGVRHADGLFVSQATFEEAKFMLVCCSAFVNYLIAEYGKINGDQT